MKIESSTYLVTAKTSKYLGISCKMDKQLTSECRLVLSYEK